MGTEHIQEQIQTLQVWEMNQSCVHPFRPFMNDEQLNIMHDTTMSNAMLCPRRIQCMQLDTNSPPPSPLNQLCFAPIKVDGQSCQMVAPGLLIAPGSRMAPKLK